MRKNLKRYPILDVPRDAVLVEFRRDGCDGSTSGSPYAHFYSIVADDESSPFEDGPVLGSTRNHHRFFDHADVEHEDRLSVVQGSGGCWYWEHRVSMGYKELPDDGAGNVNRDSVTGHYKRWDEIDASQR